LLSAQRHRRKIVFRCSDELDWRDARHELLTGNGFGRTGPVARRAENTLAINDAEVSRRHAIIHAQGDGGYYLVDLGSRNGTILNGQRMRMPAQLKDNDRIQISTTVLVFRASEMENADGEEAMVTIASAQTSAISRR